MAKYDYTTDVMAEHGFVEHRISWKMMKLYPRDIRKMLAPLLKRPKKHRHRQTNWQDFCELSAP